MFLKDIIDAKGMTMYSLSKSSGVPVTTIRDLCNGKTNFMKCSLDNVYKISSTLNIRIEDMISASKDEQDDISFDIFRGNEQHKLRFMGERDYIKSLLVDDSIKII